VIRNRQEQTAAYAVLIAASAVAVYPLLSILALALSPPGHPPGGFSLPTSFYLGNFSKAWQDGLFAHAILSSLIVSTSVVAVTIVLAVPAGFALGTSPARGLRPARLLLVLGIVLPYEAMVIPLYDNAKHWGILNTYWGLILPQIGLSMPLAVLWLRVAFQQTPRGLLEAAALDGAGRLRSLLRIVLPITVPALLTLATLLFLFTWNEFLLALVLVPDNRDVLTAPLALSFFAGNRRTGDPAVTAAAAVLVALPILAFYVVMQRRFISGMLAGAIKE
jgi:ABC-type glycerol-3-phosphate transport system permease component